MFFGSSLRDPRPGRPRLLAAALLALSFSQTRPASAEPLPTSGSGALALAAVTVVLGGVIMSIGAQYFVLEGQPSKGWGRASIGFGAANTVLGGALLVGGALASERDQGPYFGVGGFELGLGVQGIFWGLLSEGMLPAEDPGIEGQPRPSDKPLGAPATLQLRATF